MSTIADNLTRVKTRILDATVQAGRKEKDITLVAVSKTRSAAEVTEAAATGQVDFGENYLQDALDKINALTDHHLRWHFIGPIQSNKTRDIAARFDWVHSVDRFKIAQRLSAQRPDNLPPLNICLQINISDEVSKSGLTPDQLTDLLPQIAALPNVRLRGLMAIPAPANDPAQQRKPFAALRALRDDLRCTDLPLECLSMGMSADLEAAIAEGATHVRVGTAIFGPRL